MAFGDPSVEADGNATPILGYALCNKFRAALEVHRTERISR